MAVHTPPPAEMPMPELTINEDAFYNKLLGEVKRSPRATATAATDVPAIENTFEKDFLAIREEMIGSGKPGDKNLAGIKTVEDLDRLITKYSDPGTYAKLTPQAQFLALQLRALKPFKGFIFRAKRYIAGISATRTMIVTALRAQIAGIQAFFPMAGDASVNHWEVVFKYVTENVPGVGTEILHDEQLYSFFTHVALDYSLIMKDFGALVLMNKPIWWDNKLYMSFASFASEKDRYVLLGKPELYALYAAGLANVSVLCSTTAYSFTGLRQSIKSVGELFGIDSITAAVQAYADGGGAQGMTSYSRIGVLNDHEDLFVLVKDGKTRMNAAYSYLVAAARASRISFEETKKLPEGQDNLFDPRVANAFNRVAGTSFSNIDQLIDEKEPVTSAVVNGERVKVSLKTFYDNPPAKLSEMYPVAWDLSSQGKEVSVPGYSDKGQKLRNYKYGMATEWPLEPYKKIFPELTGYPNPKAKDNKNAPKMLTKDVPKYVRILGQTWGASVFAVPLSAAIF